MVTGRFVTLRNLSIPASEGTGLRVENADDFFFPEQGDPIHVGAVTIDVGVSVGAGPVASRITEADLAAYRPVVRTPLRQQLGDWDIATNPPPSVGGPMLAVMLSEMARRGSYAWADTIDVQRRVLTYRSEVHDFSADLEEDGYTMLEEVRRSGLKGLNTSQSTAHVSAVDSDGLACAITASSGYSSGATVPGTGLLLNNCLGEPELNRLGLHVLAPGTRLASNMAPSVARHRGGDVLAIGSPGADRITTALMQVLTRHCLLGMPLGEAIAAPRVHVRVVKGEPLRVEYDREYYMKAGLRYDVATLFKTVLSMLTGHGAR